MKSFLPPLLLLAALLCFSLVNSTVMVRDTDRWSEPLAQADVLAAQNDLDGAKAKLQDSYDDWSRSQTYLHIIEEHDAVDGAEDLYRRAYAFADAEDVSAFRAEIADLRNQLLLLAEMERVTIRNVL